MNRDSTTLHHPLKFESKDEWLVTDDLRALPHIIEAKPPLSFLISNSRKAFSHNQWTGRHKD